MTKQHGKNLKPLPMIAEESKTKNAREIVDMIFQDFSYLQVKNALAAMLWELQRNRHKFTTQDMIDIKIALAVLMLVCGEHKSIEVIVTKCLSIFDSVSKDIKTVQDSINKFTEAELQEAKELVKKLKLDTSKMRRVSNLQGSSRLAIDE